jgi:drug/metabolite transporter (DMT)-like permease
LKQKKIGTYFFAVFAMLFWGMSFIWSKVVFEYYSPLTTVFLRLILSSAFLLSYILILRKAQKIKKQDYGLFLLSALFNPFLYFLGESYGLQLVSPTISAVIIATIPLFAPLLGFFAYREKLSKLNIIGIVISFAGVMVMLLEKDFSFGASPRGIIYLFGAVVAALLYNLVLKKLTKTYTPLCIVAYQNTIGIFYFLPFFLIFDWNNFLLVKPNTELIGSLVMLAIFASSLAFIFYAQVVKDIGISKANVYSNLIPVFTAAFSFLILNEYFDINKIVGMLIVVGGIMLSQIKRGTRIIISG